MVVKIVQFIIYLARMKGHSISFKIMYNFIYLRILLSELHRQKRLNMLPEKLVVYCPHKGKVSFFFINKNK